MSARYDPSFERDVQPGKCIQEERVLGDCRIRSTYRQLLN